MSCGARELPPAAGYGGLLGRARAARDWSSGRDETVNGTASFGTAARLAVVLVLRVLLVLPVLSCACDWAVCVPDQGACAARARALSRSLTYGCVP